jgi:hypothetical protein
MSIASEELATLLKAFEIAAEVDDDSEMQRILGIEDVQLHFYASENECLFHFVKKGIKQKGYEKAVTYLIQFGLVSSYNRGYTPSRNLVSALETAIDHGHFRFVKLLVPMLDAHPLCLHSTEKG